MPQVHTANFMLYADESESHEYPSGLVVARMRLTIDHDVSGSFEGLTGLGCGDDTLASVWIDEVELWSVPLTIGMFGTLDWQSDPRRVRPGSRVRVEVSGPFESLVFVVRKDPPAPKPKGRPS